MEEAIKHRNAVWEMQIQWAFVRDIDKKGTHNYCFSSEIVQVHIIRTFY